MLIPLICWFSKGDSGAFNILSSTCVTLIFLYTDQPVGLFHWVPLRKLHVRSLKCFSGQSDKQLWKSPWGETDLPAFTAALGYKHHAYLEKTASPATFGFGVNLKDISINIKAELVSQCGLSTWHILPDPHSVPWNIYMYPWIANGFCLLLDSVN